MFAEFPLAVLAVHVAQDRTAANSNLSRLGKKRVGFGLNIGRSSAIYIWTITDAGQRESAHPFGVPGVGPILTHFPGDVVSIFLDSHSIHPLFGSKRFYAFSVYIPLVSNVAFSPYNGWTIFPMFNEANLVPPQISG